MKWFKTYFDGSESCNLPLQPKDLVLQFRTPIITADEPKILDFWQMKGESELWITNKEDELPPGFELHPTEVSNALASKMVTKLNSGWKPGEIIHYPSIWRVRAGDRVVIIGERSYLEDGMYLGLFEFRESALVYWLCPDGQLPSINDVAKAVLEEGDNTSQEWMRRAYSRVSAMGVPNIFSEDWSLG